MRSGAQSLTHFLWIAIPAFALAACYTSFSGAGVTALAVIYLMVKFCNSLDRSEIKAGSKSQSKGRRSY